MTKDNKTVNTVLNDFIQQVKGIITTAQTNAIRAVSTERVMMYWKIGEKIILEEQNGKERAEYGTFLIEHLSKELSASFGSGFSQRQLETCRQFFKVFPIPHTLRAELNWTHFVELIRLKNTEVNLFYANKIAEANWGVRELETESYKTGALWE